MTTVSLNHCACLHFFFVLYVIDSYKGSSTLPESPPDMEEVNSKSCEENLPPFPLDSAMESLSQDMQKLANKLLQDVPQGKYEYEGKEINNL